MSAAGVLTQQPINEQLEPGGTQAMSKHGRDANADHAEQVGIIDHEIHRLWKQFRHTNVSSSSALLKIDLLLEQRHDLTTSQGEMLNPEDVASITEWGGAQL